MRAFRDISHDIRATLPYSIYDYRNNNKKNLKRFIVGIHAHQRHLQTKKKKSTNKQKRT